MPLAAPSADVIVIGAGVIGLSLALELCRAGLRVQVIARAPVGQGSASWAGGGILSPIEAGSIDDAALSLLRDSLGHYAAWCAGLHEASGIDPEYSVSGMRVLPPVAAAQWAGMAAHCGLGRCTWTDTPDTAVELPDVAQVRSPRLLRALAQALRAAGGELVEDEAVEALLGAERVTGVRTPRGDRHASVVVIAAGAWSTELCAQIEVRPMRGQMLLLDARPGELDAILLREGRYLIPRRDGRIVAGSTLEDVGFADRTTDAARESLLRSVQAMAPRLATRPVLAHWSGLRPAPRGGGGPWIGWVQARRGLFVSSGHHRLGITLAPGSARQAAGRILAGQ